MKFKRLQFAKKFILKPDSFWENVFFSDETYVQINLDTVMNRIRRFQSSDPLNQTYLRQTVKHPLKVMIWGCFCSAGPGRIFICDQYMNSQKYVDVLDKKLLPSISDYMVENAIHLDDSAPCHRTKLLEEFHKNNSIERIDWPGNSPDLNPIENLWAILKFRLRRRIIRSKRKLIEEIIKVWTNEIPKSLFKTLALSMRTRLSKVIENKGNVTKY